MRKGEQAREEIVKDVNGQILSDGLEQVLNVADVRKANINIVGNWGCRCWEIRMKKQHRWSRGGSE